MPTDPPMLRDRFIRLAPSVRLCGDSVPNAMMLSGMKTKPRPTPCTSPVTTKGVALMARFHPVISHSE